MVNLCKANGLSIKHEKTLVEIIEKYLKHRDSLPILAEDDPKIKAE